MSTSQYSKKNISESNQQNINTPLITPYDKLTYLNSKGYGYDNQILKYNNKCNKITP